MEIDSVFLYGACLLRSMEKQEGVFIMKKWIALILNVVMVSGLTACGSRQSEGGDTSSRNETQIYETETSKTAELSQPLLIQALFCDLH